MRIRTVVHVAVGCKAFLAGELVDLIADFDSGDDVPEIGLGDRGNVRCNHKQSAIKGLYTTSSARLLVVTGGELRAATAEVCVEDEGNVGTEVRRNAGEGPVGAEVHLRQVVAAAAAGRREDRRPTNLRQPL